MATRVVPPGFSEDRVSIINPVALIETLIRQTGDIKRSGIFRINQSPPTFQKYGANLPANIKNSPGISPSTYIQMLSEEADLNDKSYLAIPTVESFTRISASGNKNICWFDSFLMCMSPSYRSLSLANRPKLISGFRNWCRLRQDKILEQMPSFMPQNFVNIFKNDLDTLSGPIEAHTGFMIAWYFGVNIIYYILNDKGIFIFNDSIINYQSPDCKTIFMIHSGGMTGGAHYEPLGILGLTDDNKYDEKKSTFLFEWTDPRLCKLPGRPAEWTQPNCSITPPLVVKGQLGGPTYYEGQDNALSCGRHALNNMLHRPKFIKEGGVLLDTITKDPNLKEDVQINLPRICELYQTEVLKRVENTNINLCKETEDYDSVILIAALNIIGFETVQLDINNLPKNVEDNTYGFLINSGRHWVSATREGDTYMYYNSIAPDDNSKNAIPYPNLYTDINRTKKIYGSNISAIFRVIKKGTFINPVIEIEKTLKKKEVEASSINVFGKKKSDVIQLINASPTLNDESKVFLIDYIVKIATGIELLEEFTKIFSQITNTNIESVKKNSDKPTKNVSETFIKRLRIAIESRKKLANAAAAAPAAPAPAAQPGTVGDDKRITLKTNPTQGKPAIEVVVGIGDKVKLKKNTLNTAGKCLGTNKYGMIGTIVGIDKTDKKGLVVSVNCNEKDAKEITGAWYKIDDLEPVVDETTVAAAPVGGRRRKTRRCLSRKKRVTHKRKHKHNR